MEKMPGGDAWRMRTSEDGCLCTWVEISYALDGTRTGPDRTVFRKDVWPVAYAGDVWQGDPSAGSTLTVTSPSGQTDTYPLTGRGLLPVCFDQKGRWTVSLVSGEKSLSSAVTVLNRGYIISFR